MMHDRNLRVSLFGAALLVGLATLGAPRSASASSSFPAAMQKALTKTFPGTSFCVPLCNACHLTTLGGPANMNVFGTNLEHQPTFPNLILGNSVNVDQKVEDAITRYFASTPAAGLATAPATFPDGTRPSYDSDGDGVSDYEELKLLDSPSLPGALGAHAFCPDDPVTYGCGARIAPPPPPVDRLGLFSAGLVGLGLAAFRRSKRRVRPG